MTTTLWSIVVWTFTLKASLVWCLTFPERPLNITQRFPIVSIKDYNLYVTDAAGVETALWDTATKETTFVNDTIFKSLDDKYAVVYQALTPGRNRSITFVESSPADQIQPNVYELPYNKPGDDISIRTPRLFDLVSNTRIEVGNDFVGKDVEYIEDVQWGFRDNKYRYMVVERGHKALRMVEIDMSGRTRLLLEERNDKGIDTYSKISWGFLNETTDQMWWLSERDGWNHVYFINTTRIEGRDTPTADSITQVTKGEFDVLNVVRVDEEAQVLFFFGYGMVKDQNPYHLHLARINFDGTGLKVLTADGDGYHSIEWRDEPANNTFEDTWSRVDQPQQGVVRDADGNRLETLQVDATILANITLPERFTAPGRDGQTPIWGIIVRPTTFNPSKKYRVLEQVYAAPQDFYTPIRLAPGSQLWLAEAFQKVADDNDVVVVSSDGMGTSFRGRAFRDVAYRNLQDAGFPDRIAWIKAAAATRPYMDLAGGVGIYGTSAGGQSAMAALIWHSDFYSAAIADAGCHDNRIDKQWWNEVYVGYPVNTTLYDAASNVVHAHKVNGSLLLLVGELDENVDPSSALQVVNALNKARKDFDFMIVPGAGHGVIFEDLVQLQNKIKRFWKNWKSGNGLG